MVELYLLEKLLDDQKMPDTLDFIVDDRHYRQLHFEISDTESQPQCLDRLAKKEDCKLIQLFQKRIDRLFISRSRFQLQDLIEANLREFRDLEKRYYNEVKEVYTEIKKVALPVTTEEQKEVFMFRLAHYDALSVVRDVATQLGVGVSYFDVSYDILESIDFKMTELGVGIACQKYVNLVETGVLTRASLQFPKHSKPNGRPMNTYTSDFVKMVKLAASEKSYQKANKKPNVSLLVEEFILEKYHIHTKKTVNRRTMEMLIKDILREKYERLKKE